MPCALRGDREPVPWGHVSAGRDGGPASHGLPLGVRQTSGCLVALAPTWAEDERWRSWARCLVPTRESGSLETWPS